MNARPFRLIIAALLFSVSLASCNHKEVAQKPEDLTWEKSQPVTADDLPEYAGKQKAVRFEVTSDKALFPSKQLVFARIDHWAKVTYPEMRPRYVWGQVIAEPRELHFTCGEHKIPISVKTGDLDITCLDLYFRDKGKHIPDSFDFARRRITEPDTIYEVLGLPAETKLTVIGAVSKDGDGYKLESFKIDHPDKNPQGVRATADVRQVIVSSLEPDRLKQYLHSDRYNDAYCDELNHAGNLPELPKVE